jgi:hypothetical protein
MRTFILLAAALIAGSSTFAQNKKIPVAPGITASVNHQPGSPTIQVLIPGVETIELDLNGPVAETYQIKVLDFNFDGQKDFAFVAVNQSTGMQPYDIFLYRPAEKTFEALEVPGGVCERFANVRLNASEKTLRSSCKAGTKTSLDTYVWKDQFTLELKSSVDHSLEAQEDAADQSADEKAEKAEKRAATKEEVEEKKKAKKEEKDTKDED